MKVKGTLKLSKLDIEPFGELENIEIEYEAQYSVGEIVTGLKAVTDMIEPIMEKIASAYKKFVTIDKDIKEFEEEYTKRPTVKKEGE